jgi:hypothetical protein
MTELTFTALSTAAAVCGSSVIAYRQRRTGFALTRAGELSFRWAG